MNTNTAGSRDWLGFNVAIDVFLPRNYMSVSGSPSDFAPLEPNRTTEVLSDSAIRDPLLAYVCEVAGTSADLDQDFETTAVEGWLKREE